MVLFILVVLGISPIIYTSGSGQVDKYGYKDGIAGKAFIFFWSIFVFIGVFIFIRMPHSMIYNKDTMEITFCSLISKKKVDIRQIFEIETSAIQSVFITFKYESGRLTMLNKINGLYELISQIKKANPILKTIGI